ncbi:uncharacterized protein BDZ99DRAFT_389710 [Mytilinidion resinicola]|uniref:Uncharacterized protein n=1 Tax=Mytilinidion resinicola TaxID=574789 RepID=A0A6A6YK29_9PEZI|nr:uncharacterized protein BDZ99DRAFT_389710 [Mytilinidion resinicola]KAF2809212.1 hypothetical protein BDZ99DRAFT_389710 [Mytilinidion resinicola]
MPHKHKRKDADVSTFDLPPTSRAAPLPTRKPTADKPKPLKKRKQRIEGYGVDDTPKAFSRLMHFQSTGKGNPKGLDDGERKSKKRKLEDGASASSKKPKDVAPPMKIMPGERMSDFAQRVNQALPVSGLSRKGKKVEGVKERLTKHNKKLAKLQKGWREEEARIRDKEEEARELAEEEQDEIDAIWEDKTAPLSGKKGKKSKRRKVVGEQDDSDGDPWEALKATREQPKGLHDVVQAPPVFTTIPREKFKVRNGAKAEVADVPNKSGSLKRREELGEQRKGIIEQYRAMMDGKRGVQAT